MILQAIEQEQLSGVFNATAPNPVTNAELMRELRRALRRPWSPPVPEFAARIGSWLMGTEASLALVSQRCIPERFLERNFQFEFPTLGEALANIYPPK
jgi:NAD dependent epimerase/dehydratase family enzyme